VRTIRLTHACGILLICGFYAVAGTTSPAVDSRFEVGGILVKDDFDKDLSLWSTELEKGGNVEIHDGALAIDVPSGCTVWLKTQLQGPVMIEYQATVIKNGGANDRASDLNCFWMARDSRSPDDLFATERSGKFSEYNPLKCYYVGLGGNGNTTTRFRRYIGDATTRPLLPEHDLRDPDDMIVANQQQTIRLIACAGLIQFYRDDRRMFEWKDSDPYTSGWFGFRTTQNHMSIRHFRVYRLVPK
jgi:hypothetical protein